VNDDHTLRETYNIHIYSPSVVAKEQQKETIRGTANAIMKETHTQKLQIDKRMGRFYKFIQTYFVRFCDIELGKSRPNCI